MDTKTEEKPQEKTPVQKKQMFESIKHIRPKTNKQD